jgi:hypothetical protein
MGDMDVIEPLLDDAAAERGIDPGPQQPIAQPEGIAMDLHELDVREQVGVCGGVEMPASGKTVRRANGPPVLVKPIYLGMQLRGVDRHFALKGNHRWFLRSKAYQVFYKYCV